ncbi:endonuclease domain-containing protein [Asticcacaulis machinosus]|uniref:Endonuclease domain-containing protein n=1 Tax=Asticcacaulis machinosus TaxID=2984211 RepID=A0ABT5HG67_9CAUL|nr:endonuclease domain-containing protein [Asticcacaulis machinosus]
MKPKYELARGLRRALTPPELMLWDRVKLRQPDGPTFRRQYAIGIYILDFYCIKARLAVEVDGEVHNLPAKAQHDEARINWLKTQGIETLRIPAKDIFERPDEVADGVWLMAVERLRAGVSPPLSLRDISPK